MERARNVAVILVCLVLLWPIGEAAYTVRQFRQRLSPTLDRLDRTASSLDRTALSLDQSVAAWRDFSVESVAFTREQRKLFGSEKTQRSIGMFLRSGDDFARAADRLNGILDSVERSAEIVEKKTLPAANVLLADGHELLTADGKSVRSILGESERTVAEIARLVQSPEVKTALSALSTVAENGVAISKNIDLTSSEIRAAIPDLLASLRGVARNTEETTSEVAELFKKLNRPLTKKEKALGVLLRIVTAAGPSIVELLRR